MKLPKFDHTLALWLFIMLVSYDLSESEPVTIITLYYYLFYGTMRPNETFVTISHMKTLFTLFRRILRLIFFHTIISYEKCPLLLLKSGNLR